MISYLFTKGAQNTLLLPFSFSRHSSFLLSRDLLFSFFWGCSTGVGHMRERTYRRHSQLGSGSRQLSAPPGGIGAGGSSIVVPNSIRISCWVAFLFQKTLRFLHYNIILLLLALCHIFARIKTLIYRVCRLYTRLHIFTRHVMEAAVASINNKIVALLRREKEEENGLRQFPTTRIIIEYVHLKFK